MLKEQLADHRVEVDERDETVGKRIRDRRAREDPPTVIVYGDKESDEALAVRKRGREQSTLSLDRLRAEISEVLPCRPASRSAHVPHLASLSSAWLQPSP